MARSTVPGGRLSRPSFSKTPFGGQPTAKTGKTAKGATSQLLPGRKALARVSKPGTPLQEFNRLDPIGSGALNQGFLNTKVRSS